MSDDNQGTAEEKPAEDSEPRDGDGVNSCQGLAFFGGERYIRDGDSRSVVLRPTAPVGRTQIR